MSERRAARLFVGLDLPDEARRALAEWACEQLGRQRELRLVAPDNLHVTLCFLGWREEAEVGRIGELTVACAGPVAGLALGQPTWVPRRRPRLLAVDLHDRIGELTALASRVSDALAAGIGYQPEQRSFWPHVTVARVRRGATLRPLEPTAPEPLPFAGQALTLYRSHLGRAGAHYEALVRAAL